ncbi:8959_t:CDS:2 [Ambispora leptoticha]|uniref:8959_t:CDS:1 n=1 Tax=Ambispora leptoticha TaxID=144679 RepID=A0A9N9F619_9GLOM|nr:8959_t:CDS:2 [Ambispora leptoticha]
MNTDESSSNIDDLHEIIEENNVSLLSEKENKPIAESSTRILSETDTTDTQVNDMLNEALDTRNKILNSLHYLDTTDQAVQHLVQDMKVYINVIKEPVITEELLENSEIIDMF